MMENVVQALIKKKAFTQDMIITASYRSVDLFGRVFDKVGEFRVNRIIKQENNDAMFELVTLNGTKMVIKAPVSSIKTIDGMDLIRFADIYDILPDGSMKKVGRKRGRKPKTTNEQI